jgi:hypothetical protein
MKSTSFKKQLILSKETIANLSESAMDQVHGGHDYTEFTHCASCLLITCPGTRTELC